MLQYEDIVEAPLEKLKAAADDWSEMATNLDKLATQASDGMKAKANKASWEGLNAGVTREFIGKTAKEFADAAAEAKGVKTLLEEGYTAFKKAKDDLVNIREHEGPAAGIRVDGRGKVTARSPISEDNTARHDPDFSKYLQQERENIESWQKRIDLIVDNCNDTDVTFKNSLEANVTDRKDFSAPKYTKFDQEEADRAAGLAAKGRDLTHTELQSLNELLRDNGRSAEFAKTFYEKLGPEKALAFFGQLSTDASGYGKADKERLADVQTLQRNLGLNLATASNDRAFSAEWGSELRKIGTERIPLARNDYGGVYGYQLLGGIMRYGNYDAKFLNPIAEHVAQLHRKNPNFFAGANQANAYAGNPFNPSGKSGSGFDPVTSMLEALGNSPDAAKKFFTDSPTAYNDDGTVDRKNSEPLGKDADGEKNSYLDFFGNEKWKSFPDTGADSPGATDATRQYMPDALGRALEAATLGYPAGEPDARVKRDDDNAAVMQKVMEKYGADAGLLKRQEGLADSLGVMGAGYIDDLNWALEKGNQESAFAPPKNEEGKIEPGHIPFGDTREDGRNVARDFLSALGQHPDAYATVATAEQAYIRSVLETHVGPDGIDSGAARATVRAGAEVQGMLDQSRADQVQADRMKTHEDYEKAVAKRAGWVEFGATAGVAAGVAFLPVTAAVGAAAVLIPLATDTASGAAEQVIGQVVGDFSDGSVEKSKEKAEESTREEWDRIYRYGETMAEAPMEDFLALHTTKEDSDLREDLRQAMLVGYGVGNDRENQQGVDPETG
ncbi:MULTISPECIES: hypothetical protein [Streptomyces]|uniref:hypothetical protein n=1 Tax=Streptomyces TaxID=1883 RepID=UPI001BDCE483|nr:MULTISPECIES: hypothetical protein [Streptomyces]MBT1103498.1 hypothetical protein [Streptomyces sp. Tu10]WUC89016.1 hypothetical protein OHQ35_24290 [Streptomyces anulatus]WUD91185.1 hypothetical protein OG703_24825 [Streptomyces anulatus]